MSHTPLIRAYLRASTDDQDANRARGAIRAFAKEMGVRVVAWYRENASGASLERSELERLIADSEPGDVLLVEQVDRLTRLNKNDWDILKAAIQTAGLRVVAIDLPTSYAALTSSDNDGFTGRMLDAVNSMLLDMAAAMSRKDYEDRRRRQAEGIEKARERGAYRGRPVNQELHNRILELRSAGFSYRKTAEMLGCGVSTVQRAVKQSS